MKALKFLKPGGIGPYSNFEWPVPSGKPGKWVSVKGDLVECMVAVHACTLEQAIDWLQSECYVIELAGRVIVGHDKIVARKGRLLYATAFDDRALRLFAADCAEHVLHLFEQERPNDDRPRKAIEAARAFANANTGAAARAAAEDAAWNAAWAAAEDAAWNAAGAAAEDAAWKAAGAAAEAAAGAAAWNAAWAAAEDAARAAAGAVARDAERRWQTRRLRHYLKLPKGWDK